MWLLYQTSIVCEQWDEWLTTQSNLEIIEPWAHHSSAQAMSTVWLLAVQSNESPSPDQPRNSIHICSASEAYKKTDLQSVLKLRWSLLLPQQIIQSKMLEHSRNIASVNDAVSRAGLLREHFCESMFQPWLTWQSEYLSRYCLQEVEDDSNALYTCKG